MDGTRKRTDWYRNGGIIKSDLTGLLQWGREVWRHLTLSVYSDRIQ